MFYIITALTIIIAILLGIIMAIKVDKTCE